MADTYMHINEEANLRKLWMKKIRVNHVELIWLAHLGVGWKPVSRVGDPEKEAYFVRNKNPTVMDVEWPEGAL